MTLVLCLPRPPHPNPSLLRGTRGVPLPAPGTPCLGGVPRRGYSRGIRREPEPFGSRLSPTFNPRCRCEAVGPEAAAYLLYLRPPQRWPRSTGDPRGRPPSLPPSSPPQHAPRWGHQALLAPLLPWDPSLPSDTRFPPHQCPRSCLIGNRRGGRSPCCPPSSTEATRQVSSAFCFLLPRSNTHYSC